jgi:pyruvate kinase
LARRTKIVATIGPASRSPECVRDLISAGIDVARLNFAHGEPDEHGDAARTVRAQSKDSGKVIGLLADLPGPKMRTGPIEGDEVRLETGSTFTLTSDDVEGNAQQVSTSLDDIADICEEGNELFLADGQIVLKAVECKKDRVIAEVIRGGVLRSGKGMHIPGAVDKVEAFTDEDREALNLAVKLSFDYVGLSFIRDGDDVRRVQDALPRDGHRPLVVAKIETSAAVDNLEGIIDRADAVMVARGDLRRCSSR